MNRDDLVERLHQSVSDKDLRIWRLVVEAANTITALHAEVAALRAQAGKDEPFGYVIEKSGVGNGYYYITPAEFQHVEERFHYLYKPLYEGVRSVTPVVTFPSTESRDG